MSTMADSLAKLLTMAPPEFKANWAADEKREAELSEVLRTNCVDAIEMIASAMRHPRIALSDLESAIAMLSVARDCAKALDQ